MDKRALREAVEHQFDEWADKLVAAHHFPLLVVAEGRDGQLGKLHVIVRSVAPARDVLAAILHRLAADLEREGPLQQIEIAPTWFEGGGGG